MESKGDIGIYERDGIKFIYKPLEINATEGTESTTTLKAIKDLDSFQMIIKASDVEKLLPIAKNDVEMFNRIIVGFLSGKLNCTGSIKIEKEKSVDIEIKVDIIGKIYEIKLKLLYENVGEMIALRRKVDYLMEELERVKSTFRFNFILEPQTNGIITYDTLGNRKKYKYEDLYPNTKMLNSIGQSFVESKTEGIFKNISNYDLIKLLEHKSDDYKKCVKITEGSADQYISKHPFLDYIARCPNIITYTVNLYFLAMNYLGYEMTDLVEITQTRELTTIISSNVVKSPNKHKYLVSEYCYVHDVVSGTDNQKNIWIMRTNQLTNKLLNHGQSIIVVEKIKI